MVILGFDPGGKRQFGWCVAQGTNTGNLQLRASDIASHADEAVTAALRKAADFGGVEAAGIDSPLFWVADGDRNADKSIRSAMKRLGAINLGGSVQQVNSLRGACLSQGIMAAHLLRRELPEIRITESHPKALLWLLHVARIKRPVVEVGIGHLGDFIESESLRLSDHERDAALGAVAAWAMINNRNGWRDLYREEKNAFTPVSPIELDASRNTNLTPTGQSLRRTHKRGSHSSGVTDYDRRPFLQFPAGNVSRSSASRSV